MNPGRLDLTVTRGDTYARTLQIDGLEAALDGLFTGLTTANFAAVIERRHYGPAADQTPFAVSVTSPGPDSYVVALALTDEETGGLAGVSYVWSLRVTDLPGDPDDQTHTVLAGSVSVPAVTHRQAA